MNTHIIHRTKNLKRATIFALFISSLLLTTGTVKSQDGEAIFKQSCAACHSVGKGRLVGPDLQGVTNKRSEEWLGKFIKSSQSLINSGDADAKAIFDEFNGIIMPDQNLNDGQLKSVIAYLKANSPTEETTDKETVPKEEIVVEQKDETPSKVATPQDILAGMNLFEGGQSFKNGGPACISCHNVTNDKIIGGGRLAKDLTTAYSRLGGEAGISGMLNSPPFPAMASAYGNDPLTEEEIFQLAAFLKDADQQAVYQHARTFDGVFIYGGGFGLLTMLLLIYLIWFNRKKQTVKHDIYRRQIKSIDQSKFYQE